MIADLPVETGVDEPGGNGLSSPSVNHWVPKFPFPRLVDVVTAFSLRGIRRNEEVEVATSFICEYRQLSKVHSPGGYGMCTRQSTASVGAHEDVPNHGHEVFFDPEGVFQILLRIVKVHLHPFTVGWSTSATVVDRDGICLVDSRAICPASADYELKTKDFPFQELVEEHRLCACHSR